MSATASDSSGHSITTWAWDDGGAAVAAFQEGGGGVELPEVHAEVVMDRSGVGILGQGIAAGFDAELGDCGPLGAIGSHVGQVETGPADWFTGTVRICVVLPQPFGPTMAVMPLANSKVVRVANVLYPCSSSDLRRRAIYIFLL